MQADAQRVTEYVNRATATASIENRIQQVVRRAVRECVAYVARDASLVGTEVAQAYGRALAFAEAAEIATGGELSEQDVFAAAHDATATDRHDREHAGGGGTHRHAHSSA